MVYPVGYLSGDFEGAGLSEMVCPLCQRSSDGVDNVQAGKPVDDERDISVARCVFCRGIFRKKEKGNI
jgi:hypothetical protein